MAIFNRQTTIDRKLINGIVTVVNKSQIEVH